MLRILSNINLFSLRSSLLFFVLTCYLFSSRSVGVAGGTSCLMPDVSVVWVNVMWRRSAASFLCFVCSTTVEMRTSRVSSGSSSHRRRTGVNPKHYSTTLVGAAHRSHNQNLSHTFSADACIPCSFLFKYLFIYLFIYSLTLCFISLPRSVYPCSKRQEG